VVIKLSADQFAAADQIAEEQWFDALKAALFDHHMQHDTATKERLFVACRVECVRLGVQSEAALHAYFDLSFALGDLLSAEPTYQQMHPIFLRQHGTADRLPLYLYEKSDA
jgi:hypothetical protein